MMFAVHHTAGMVTHRLRSAAAFTTFVPRTPFLAINEGAVDVVYGR